MSSILNKLVSACETIESKAEEASSSGGTSSSLYRMKWQSNNISSSTFQDKAAILIGYRGSNWTPLPFEFSYRLTDQPTSGLKIVNQYVITGYFDNEGIHILRWREVIGNSDYPLEFNIGHQSDGDKYAYIFYPKEITEAFLSGATKLTFKVEGFSTFENAGKPIAMNNPGKDSVDENLKDIITKS